MANVHENVEKSVKVKQLVKGCERMRKTIDHNRSNGFDLEADQKQKEVDKMMGEAVLLLADVALAIREMELDEVYTFLVKTYLKD